MKRIAKPDTSPIIVNSYTYPIDKVAILAQLEIEHDSYCAYTEEYFCPGYARDIEHFNPTLKNTTGDGYQNWFAASTRFNRKKGSKARWLKHQPILHPTDANLETKLIYEAGYYIATDPNDVHTKNLQKFLFLNDLGLPRARIAYINMLKELLKGYNGDLDKLRDFLLKNTVLIKYRTAIKTELNIIL
jgi:hypothetical protein